MDYEGFRFVTPDDLTDTQRAEKERRLTIDTETIEAIESSLKGQNNRSVGARAITAADRDAYATARMNQDSAPSDPHALPPFEKEGGETTGGIDA